ncbi:MAG: single-stranded DNA-binding protein [Polyangiaceae bacterium]
MGNGHNRVILFGNLGADPELRKLPSGTSALRMRLATSRSWTNKEGVREEQTEWHYLTVYGNRADGLARVLKKGSRLLIEGRLHSYFVEKEDGRRYYTEVHVEDVCLAGRGRSSSESPEPDDAELAERAALQGEPFDDRPALDASPPRAAAFGPEGPGEFELDADAGPSSGSEPHAGPTAPARPARPREPELFDPPSGSGRLPLGSNVPVRPAPRRKPRSPAGSPASAMAMA